MSDSAETGADRPPREPVPGVLTDVERAVLDFADLWWRYQGAKEAAIRERFGWSSTRYYQVLGALSDRPEADVYAPALVARLRRLRDARRDQRSIDGRGLRDDV
jgi:hypothetical protein